MSKLSSTAWSSVGRKFLAALTGAGLIIFVIAHLIGNLTLFLGPGPFNEYSDFLFTVGHGGFIVVAEIGLFLCFAIHLVAGVTVWLRRGAARPVGYWLERDAGGSSHKTLSSKTMIFTGVLLAIFVVVHVFQFRLGNGIAEGYVYTSHGAQIRDLYRVVSESFHDGWCVVFYCTCMLLLGFHLRHGFWSAFQSLGAMNRRWLPFLNALGVAIAIVLAVGFLILPIFIYFQPGPATSALLPTGGPQ